VRLSAFREVAYFAASGSHPGKTNKNENRRKRKNKEAIERVTERYCHFVWGQNEYPLVRPRRSKLNIKLKMTMLQLIRWLSRFFQKIAESFQKFIFLKLFFRKIIGRALECFVFCFALRRHNFALQQLFCERHVAYF